MKSNSVSVVKTSVIAASLIFAAVQYGRSFGLTQDVNIQYQKAGIEIPANPDSLGVLISTIEFKLKAKNGDLDTVKNHIVPWIGIDKPNEKIDSLIDADQVVAPFREAMLIIDYPLKKEARFFISSKKKGFTRRQLIKIISDKYHYIYNKEDTTATQKLSPEDNVSSESFDRVETDGTYGIWGHDISDLYLSSIQVYKDPDGQIYLVLNIES